MPKKSHNGPKVDSKWKYNELQRDSKWTQDWTLNKLKVDPKWTKN